LLSLSLPFLFTLLPLSFRPLFFHYPLPLISVSFCSPSALL
jgi:hypothetical protein